VNTNLYEKIAKRRAKAQRPLLLKFLLGFLELGCILACDKGIFIPFAGVNVTLFILWFRWMSKSTEK
jgi:hypothetical protein